MNFIERTLKKVDPVSRPTAAPQGSVVQGEVEELRWPATAKRVVHADQTKLREIGLLPPAEQRSELMDQYRVIKRPLIRKAFDTVQGADPSPKLIMLTSPLPGDGKTFTSINLARSMSLEKDSIVLLVDADVAKPHVSRVFGLHRELGLLDVLADPSMDVQSVIFETTIPKLCVLPAGKPRETATELLASARMRETMRRLATLHTRGLIVLDSPPVLITSESRALASVAGQIILVVKAGHTPQQAVKDAIAVIDRDDLSLILNNANLSGPMGEYYGYRYGHREHEFSEDGAVPVEPAQLTGPERQAGRDEAAL